MGYVMIYVVLKPHLVQDEISEKPTWQEMEEAISEGLQVGDFKQMAKWGGGYDRYGLLIPKKSMEYTMQAANKIDKITFDGGWGLEVSPAEDTVKYKLHGVYLFTPDEMTESL